MLFSTLLGRSSAPEDEPRSGVKELTKPVDARALVDQHYDFIWRLLRRMGLEPADADDATQQVFVVTLYPEPKPIKPGSERSFLYGVALNVCREFRRKRASGALHDERHLETQVAPASPDRDAEARQTWLRLQQVLQTMPEDIRLAFVLFELEGMTVPEISDLIGIPSGTVASRLRRGRELFQIEVVALKAGLPEYGS